MVRPQNYFLIPQGVSLSLFVLEVTHVGRYSIAMAQQ